MKNAQAFFILVFLSLVVTFLWSKSHFWDFNRENYISKKVLELSVPFDVRINTEFLKNLEEPANESSRTSPEGI